MGRGVIVGILTLAGLFAIMGIFYFSNTGFAVHQLDSKTLGELSSKAEVECLQNSQCSEEMECVDNQCLKMTEEDKCEKISLNTPTRVISISGRMNSVKSVLTKVDLPYLLAGGELVETNSKETIEYFYISYLSIGENRVEQDGDSFIIENKDPLYTYNLVFSNPVDFSNKNIQGQSLRILGEEYIIGSNADNSNLYLASTEKDVLIQDNDNMKIIKDENGYVLKIIIPFYSDLKIKTTENYIDNYFNSTELSLSLLNKDFVDVVIGGNC